ncbi:MAG: hypothetical protein ABR902_10745 [Candidatus Korobacteraceae bacterium]|jgi:hypothetical protein
MRRLLFVLLLWSGFLLAQNNNSGATDQNNSKNSKGQITVQGCVDRERGDYVLVKQNPAVTYELQGADKIKVGKYFGQRVEVTGTKLTSMETSSDAMAAGGSPSPVTIRVTSIKTISKQCTERSAK